MSSDNSGDELCLDIVHEGDKYPSNNVLFFGRAYKLGEKNNRVPGWVIVPIEYGDIEKFVLKNRGKKIHKSHVVSGPCYECPGKNQFYFKNGNENIAFSALVNPLIAEYSDMDVVTVKKGELPLMDYIFDDETQDEDITPGELIDPAIEAYGNFLEMKYSALKKKSIIFRNNTIKRMIRDEKKIKSMEAKLRIHGKLEKARLELSKLIASQ